MKQKIDTSIHLSFILFHPKYISLYYFHTICSSLLITMLCNSDNLFLCHAKETPISSMTSSSQMVATFSNQDSPKEIDLRGLCFSDCNAQDNNPFLHASIPGLRKAVLLDKDVVVSTLQVQTHSQLRGQVEY